MKSSASKIFKIIGSALVAYIGLFLLVELFEPSRFNPTVKLDFAQDYFLAKATVSGVNPYLPLNVLGERFDVVTKFSHPSPHPPSFAIMTVPLALFSFQ